MADIIEQLNVQPAEITNTPPWEKQGFLFDTQLAKEKLTNPLKNGKAQSLINKYGDRLAIYTDAARNKDERAAIAFYIPKIGYEESARIPDGSSIDSAEIEAIKAAKAWVVDNKDRPVFSENQRAVIFSDSLRAIHFIKNDKTLRTLHPDMTDIAIAWIPGHCNR